MIPHAVVMNAIQREGVNFFNTLLSVSADKYHCAGEENIRGGGGVRLTGSMVIRK